MKTKNDNDLIFEIKNSNDPSEALRELIKKHSGIFISVVSSICSKKDSVEFTDLIEEKDFYIYRAALKFDESRGVKFCTFLGNEARWEALNLITRASKTKKEVVREGLIYPDAESRKILGDKAIKNCIKIAKEEGDKRVHKILKLRYVEGDKNKVMPWKKIAKKLDLSIQGCINIHNNFILRIKNKIL